MKTNLQTPLPASVAVALATVCVVLLAATSCEASKKTAITSKNKVEAKFRIEGMSCASCALTVKLAAKQINGVFEAKVDVAKATAWVKYDSKLTTPQAIVAAITKAGYKATPI